MYLTHARSLTVRRGFGLLEVLFATSIFIVVVGSLVALSRLSLRNAALSAHRTQAINLAQDGLEIVRQMRDTGWLAHRAADPKDDWLTFPTVSANCSETATLNQRVAVASDYEICFYASEAFSGYGLRTSTADPGAGNRTNSGYIELAGGNGQPDPGQPLYYHRTIRFETVPVTAGPTATGCPALEGTDSGDPGGMQFLAPTEEGIICPMPNYETFQGQPLYAVKVISRVSWQDFEKDWNVELSTILTNWRTR